MVENKGMNKTIQADVNQKKAGVAIVILGKLKFRQKVGRWTERDTLDNKRCSLQRRYSRHKPLYIRQNRITVYIPPKKDTLSEILGEKIVKITTKVGYFNLPSSEFIRSSRLSINKVIKDLNAIFKSLDIFNLVFCRQKISIRFRYLHNIYKN